MAWARIPKENHPIFMAALPDDPKIEVKHMFGGVAAMFRGHMMAGLWADTAIVKLAPADYAALQALGGEPFDPMGKGHTIGETLVLPAREFTDRGRLAKWVSKARDHVATLPEKKKKAPTKKAGPAKAAPKKATPKSAAPKKR